MSEPTMDEAIRALVKAVSLATIEYACDLEQSGVDRRQLFVMRDDLADQMAEIVMQTADECPDSEVHAVRALGVKS